jgi:hypothetical protein
MPKKRRTPYLSHYLKPADNENMPNAKLATRTIRDPYDNSLRQATANVRADALGELMARNKIQHHQMEAGRELESAFERASVTGVKAMDFSREPVDGGKGFNDPYNDAKHQAGNFIAHAKRHLGDSGYRLLEMILRERHSVEDVAAALACDPRFVIVRLREALEKLATASGHTGEGPRRKSVRDKHSAAAAKVFKLAA